MPVEEPPETETLVAFRGVVLPPPEPIREYAPTLLAWAQGRPTESFVGALARRLSFGDAEREELLAGLKEVVALKGDQDLAVAAHGFSVAGKGSVGLMVVFQGLHQLMVFRPKPGKLPPELLANIELLGDMEVLLDEDAPDTAGRRYLRRYRRSLRKRDLVPASDRDDGSPDQASIGPGEPEEPEDGDLPSLPPSGAPDPAPPPALEPAAPHIAPPTMGQRMDAAAVEAANQVVSPRKKASGGPAQLRRGLLVALAVLAVVAGVQFALRAASPPRSVPADIDELPVLSMVRHTDAVIVRVSADWIATPLPARTEAANDLFARLDREHDGELMKLVLLDPSSKPVAEVTRAGATFSR